MKYIIIGETTLGIDFLADGTITAKAVGALLGTAFALAAKGAHTLFISEIGVDPAGKRIASRLAEAGVDISCCDRFTDGKTSLSLTVDSATARYDIHNETTEGFDVAWPRIEHEDVVVFGGYLALEQRCNARLRALLANTAERKATLIYVPDVADERLQRITRVMPQVFENLEIAGQVIASRADLRALYGTDDADLAFRQHVSFYCPRLDVADTPDEIADFLLKIK